MLHEIQIQPGLSTSVDEYANGYVAQGMRCQNYLVPCRSLADICAEHAPRDIHFLKIDVEGMERSVLEGSDFKHFRPWLLAIEATVPCTYTPCHEEWEHIVLGAGYEFALFHQINRYYVAREHAADLKGWIQPPVYTNARRCA
jgi:Methyltransferase FkbM domain